MGQRIGSARISRALGWVRADETAAIRREGERVIDRIERGAAPFDEDWLHWRPDPAWPVPELAPSWNRVPA